MLGLEPQEYMPAAHTLQELHTYLYTPYYITLGRLGCSSHTHFAGFAADLPPAGPSISLQAAAVTVTVRTAAIGTIAGGSHTHWHFAGAEVTVASGTAATGVHANGSHTHFAGVAADLTPAGPSIGLLTRPHPFHPHLHSDSFIRARDS